VHGLAGKFLIRRVTHAEHSVWTPGNGTFWMKDGNLNAVDGKRQATSHEPQATNATVYRHGDDPCYWAVCWQLAAPRRNDFGWTVRSYFVFAEVPLS